MTRNILLATIVLFLVLIAVDHSRQAKAAPAVVVTVPQPAAPQAGPPSPPRPLGPIVSGESESAARTPGLDMMARLAVRRRIEREGTRVYLDSLLDHSDSVVTRWPDDAIRALRVAFAIDSTLPGWSRAALADARAGMQAWNGNAAGIQLVEVPTPDSASIVVGWAETLSDSGTVGSTNLQYGADGVATSATVTLALRQNTPDSTALPPAARRHVAAHEFGHALGLPHSADPKDLMFSKALVAGPSPRDQATLQLLYAVIPGPLRIVQ